MSARANPRLVGVFVLAAIAIFAAAVLLLTGGDWFVEKERYAVYFPGSVKGLNPGAPVTFRGVKIGQVVEIVPYATNDPDDPVVIEVVLETAADIAADLPGASRGRAAQTAEEFAASEQGQKLRARLLSQSLLTGQLYIDVDFLPDAPARRTGLKLRYPELATTPTALEKMSEQADRIMTKLSELPVDEMLEDLRVTLATLRAFVDSPDLRGALEGINKSSKELPPVLTEARAALAELRELLKSTEGQVDGLGSGVRERLDQAGKVLETADRAMANLDSTIANTDQAQVTAAQTLLEMQRTLKALRNLVEYLQTHPEAVVLGKPTEETK